MNSSVSLSKARAACFSEFEKAPVRVVIIGANPKTKIWSAGHDIREIPLDAPEVWSGIPYVHRVHADTSRSPPLYSEFPAYRARAGSAGREIPMLVLDLSSHQGGKNAPFTQGAFRKFIQRLKERSPTPSASVR